MARAYSFHPRAWVLALGTAACVAGVLLGNWQSGRAAAKRDLAARLDEAARAPALELSPAADAPDAAYRRVAARGTFVPSHTVLLDNRLRQGRPGYEVVTPLKLARSEVHVLVNRGWVEAPARRERLPEFPTPAGELRIEALALPRFARILELGSSPAAAVRQNLTVEDFVARTGLALKTVVLEQRSETNDGLRRDWPRADAGIEKHESYALQWYSLAALAAVLAVVFSFRRA